MRAIWNWFLGLRPGNFLRQVLVVIVSVTLTLGLGRWVDAQKRKSYIEVSLSLVCDELKANLRDVQSNYELMQGVRRCALLLNQHQDALSKVDADTLERWIEGVMAYAVATPPERYALDVLKNSVAYEEFSNALLIYLCGVYTECDVYIRECEEAYRNTKTIMSLFYERNDPRNDVHAMVRVMMSIPQFRDRIRGEITTLGVEFGQQVRQDVERSIEIVDSLIKNDGYKEFKISPAADYIGAL